MSRTNAHRDTDTVIGLIYEMTGFLLSDIAEELAQRAGRDTVPTPQQISDWKNGRKPEPKWLRGAGQPWISELWGKIPKEKRAELLDAMGFKDVLVLVALIEKYQGEKGPEAESFVKELRSLKRHVLDRVAVDHNLKLKI